MHDADIIFGVFHAELGHETPRAASGTAEELEQGRDAGKAVHLYFSAEPVPRDHDRDQLAALDEFKAEIGKKGLYGSFDSEGNLKDQVKSAIEFDLGKMSLGAPRASGGGATAHARLHARYESDREQYLDGRGKIKYRTRGQRLIVVNTGELKAERVRLTLEPIGDGNVPELHGADDTPDIPPQGEFSYPVFAHMGTSLRVNIKLTWNEGDEERSERHSLSLT